MAADEQTTQPTGPEPTVQPSSTPDGPQVIPSPSTPPGEPGPDPVTEPGPEPETQPAETGTDTATQAQLENAGTSLDEPSDNSGAE